MAVEELVNGVACPSARQPDRAEAARILAGRGWSDKQAAARTGLTDRTVLRIRQRHGIPAGTR